MARPPIPQRIPPLRWRGPTLVWTPVALAAAIGWPAALFYNDADLQKIAVVVGAGVFAFALVTLGVGWALGMAPRSRRAVILHVLFAGALGALAAPLVLTRVLETVADTEKTGVAANFTLSMWAATAPLALILGLPIALISGMLFAWIALRRPRFDPGADDDVLGDHIFTSDVQPFR